jgi:hypothetical protein
MLRTASNCRRCVLSVCRAEHVDPSRPAVCRGSKTGLSVAGLPLGRPTCGKIGTCDGGASCRDLLWPAEALLRRPFSPLRPADPKGAQRDAADWAPRGAGATLSLYLTKFHIVPEAIDVPFSNGGEGFVSALPDPQYLFHAWPDL